MIAEFEVHEGRTLEARNLFALAGVVSEGTPRVGMRAALEDDEEAFDEPIHGVEFLEGGDEEGGTEPALTFSYSSADTLERWRAIDWSGRRLRLRWER